MNLQKNQQENTTTTEEVSSTRDIISFDMNDPIENTENSETPPFDQKTNMALIFCVTMCVMIVGCIFTTTTIDEELANKIFAEKITTKLKAGDILFSMDKVVEPYHYSDIDIATYSSFGGGLGLFIWDYAEEDGDYVQIRIDGKAYGKPFMLTHTPKNIIITNGTVLTIHGIKDGNSVGEDGITYALNFPTLHNTTLLNNAPVGGKNIYTKRES